jgi:pimeloyl-ACP methyl ester carboxylesterase
MNRSIGKSCLWVVPAFFLLFSSNGRAGDFVWNADAKRDFSKLEDRMKHRPNAELSAIWSAGGIGVGGVFRAGRFRRRGYGNDVDYFPSGKPIEYLVTRTGRQVSPLVVYFPGVFSDATDSGALLAARQLRRARNHVVILPNPWGKNFQSAQPRFLPGEFDREGRAMAEIIHDAIRFIGSHRISEIRFFGESYGGFLAAVTAHFLNTEHQLDEVPYHVSVVTSISPPFQFGNAVFSLDRMADLNEKNYFDEGCRRKTSRLLGIVGFAFQMLAKPDRDEIYTRDGVPCSDAIFSYSAFEQPLYKMMTGINARTPIPGWDSRSESDWSRKIRFHDIGPLLYGMPSDRIMSQDAASLSFWIDLIRGEGTGSIALEAKDDPLNAPNGPYPAVNPYRADEFLMLPHGGHLGFRGYAPYRRLIRDTFKKTTAERLASPKLSLLGYD